LLSRKRNLGPALVSLEGSGTAAAIQGALQVGGFGAGTLTVDDGSSLT
jgi:T5SS/PEP-CTERM-associated repeat protein